MIFGGFPLWGEKMYVLCLPREDLSHNNTNGHAKLDGKKPTKPQPHTTKNYRQLRKAGSRGGGLSQGRAHHGA